MCQGQPSTFPTGDLTAGHVGLDPNKQNPQPGSCESQASAAFLQGFGAAGVRGGHRSSTSTGHCLCPGRAALGTPQSFGQTGETHLNFKRSFCSRTSPVHQFCPSWITVFDHRSICSSICRRLVPDTHLHLDCLCSKEGPEGLQHKQLKITISRLLACLAARTPTAPPTQWKMSKEIRK